MAKGSKASTPAATEGEATETTRVGVLHQAHADYIKANKGIDVTPEQVFAIYSTRVAFRKSDAYQSGVREAKVAEKAAQQEARDAAKAQRETDRAAKAQQKAAAKAEKDAAAAAAKEAAAAAAPAEGSTTKPAGKGKNTSKGKGKEPVF